MCNRLQMALVIHHSGFDGEVRRGEAPPNFLGGGVGAGKARPHTPAHHNHCGEPLVHKPTAVNDHFLSVDISGFIRYQECHYVGYFLGRSDAA